jgi:hypothetical protein
MDAVIAAAHPSLQLGAKVLALIEAGHISTASPHGSGKSPFWR